MSTKNTASTTLSAAVAEQAVAAAAAGLHLAVVGRCLLIISCLIVLLLVGCPLMISVLIRSPRVHLVMAGHLEGGWLDEGVIRVPEQICKIFTKGQTQLEMSIIVW